MLIVRKQETGESLVVYDARHV